MSIVNQGLVKSGDVATFETPDNCKIGMTINFHTKKGSSSSVCVTIQKKECAMCHKEVTVYVTQNTFSAVCNQCISGKKLKH